MSAFGGKADIEIGRIIEQMIAQLKGETRFDWRPEGLVCEITLRV
jgi:hypothetical protein